MRLIDADAFVAKLDHVPMIQEAIRKAMDTMPTIEQPEIIRCKDCKFWQDNNGGYPNMNCRWIDDETPDADDSCSYAERKGEQP